MELLKAGVQVLITVTALMLILGAAGLLFVGIVNEVIGVREML